MSDCIFCKIAQKEIGSLIYEDELVCAFNDLNPQAKIHILIIPKIHIPSINELTEENASIISHMALSAKRIAKDLNISEDGYRIIINCNENAGQTVFHLHMHLLGGEKLASSFGK